MKIKIKDKVYEIKISEPREGEIKIVVNGKEFIFGERESGGGVTVAKTTFPKRDFFKKEIKAPIAGVISEIFVKEGDFIKREQKILFLSTMKMENEIISDFDGKAKEILVKKNQEVKEGETLIILE